MIRISKDESCGIVILEDSESQESIEMPKQEWGDLRSAMRSGNLMYADLPPYTYPDCEHEITATNRRGKRYCTWCMTDLA